MNLRPLGYEPNELPDCSTPQNHLSVVVIGSSITPELDSALAAASKAGKPVMLDFYADWCVSCKEMERFTFTDAAVQKRLAGALLLKADVTANNDHDRELLKRFRLFGPPGTIFFDASGNEIRAARLIGYQNSRGFLDTLRSAGL